MSRFILDEHLGDEVLQGLRAVVRWTNLRDLRPNQRVLDDRVPELLLRLNQPTFLTIDHGFWDARLCHPGYGLIYFAVPDDRRDSIPGLLRKLLRRPEFRSRS